MACEKVGTVAVSRDDIPSLTPESVVRVDRLDQASSEFESSRALFGVSSVGRKHDCCREPDDEGWAVPMQYASLNVAKRVRRRIGRTAPHREY